MGRPRLENPEDRVANYKVTIYLHKEQKDRLFSWKKRNGIDSLSYGVRNMLDKMIQEDEQKANN